MNIINRYHMPLKLGDYTTVGIAAKLLGINIITMRMKVINGEIPAKRNGTDASELILAIKDVVTYAIKKEVPFHREKIANYSEFHEPPVYVDRIYCHAVDNPIPHKYVEQCNLRQFINYMDYDPFNWFVIGADKGEEYQAELYNEMKRIFKPVSEKQKPFAYMLFGLNPQLTLSMVLNKANQTRVALIQTKA